MGKLVNAKIRKLLDHRESGPNQTKQGQQLEKLASYIFENMPRILVIDRNQPDRFHSQEIDLVLWNDKKRSKLDFLPHVIPIECKNWLDPVDGNVLSSFVQKLRNGDLHLGILFARSGISGNELGGTSAYHVLANALRDGYKILVITGQDLEKITHTDQIVELLKQRLWKLQIAVEIS